MKTRFLIGVLLIILLVSGAGCVKKEEEKPLIEGGISIGEKEEKGYITERQIEDTNVIVERARGLDVGQATYFYYTIHAGKGMKIDVKSDNKFDVEIMDEEDCKKKTKEEQYDVMVKEEGKESFEFESGDNDIENEDSKWCVVVTNKDSEYGRFNVKIEELTYKE